MHILQEQEPMQTKRCILNTIALSKEGGVKERRGNRGEQRKSERSLEGLRGL